MNGVGIGKSFYASLGDVRSEVCTECLILCSCRSVKKLGLTAVEDRRGMKYSSETDDDLIVANVSLLEARNRVMTRKHFT